MSTPKIREFETQRTLRVVQIEHQRAFSELAHAVFEAEPPPGGWPETIQNRIDDCKRVSQRLTDAWRAADRAKNRG